MSFGKTIKIFLIDGDPNGRMNCELSNWTGKAYKIPRIKIKDCADREDLKKTGVYLLFGKDDEGNDQVYIGEAEYILNRLNQHLSTKDFWNEAIIFLSKDDNLNKAHIKYLENRLFQLASEAKRYKLENSSTPTQSSISESDRAEMEAFIENLRMMINILGHKVFDSKREVTANTLVASNHQDFIQDNNIFSIIAARGADAKGEATSEGFVVLKGSKAAKDIVNSLPSYSIKLRQSLIDHGTLREYDKYFEFTEDYIFSSPSSASAIVMGRSSNGLTEWKLANGTTLKDFESNN